MNLEVPTKQFALAKDASSDSQESLIKPPTPHPQTLSFAGPRQVDVKLTGKGNPNSHGARPVHLIITMIRWIRTGRLSIQNSLSSQAGGVGQDRQSAEQSESRSRESLGIKPLNPDPQTRTAGLSIYSQAGLFIHRPVHLFAGWSIYSQAGPFLFAVLI